MDKIKRIVNLSGLNQETAEFLRELYVKVEKLEKYVENHRHYFYVDFGEDSTSEPFLDK